MSFRMSRLDGPKIALAALALTVAGALGLGAGALVFTDASPEALREAETVSAAPVTQRSFDDKRTVEVSLALDADTALTSPASGRVTAFSCQPGGVFTSGQANLSVDGERIVNLATSVPLWRDLAASAQGDDVVAVQQELARLGYEVPVDGIAGPATLSAVADLFHLSGDTAFQTGTIPSDRVLWIPAPETTVAGCSVSTGATVAAGETIGSLAGGLAGAGITRLPEGAVSGERVLNVDGQSIPLDADGRVSSAEALETLAASSSYAQALRGSMTSLNGSYVLAEPVTVSVVPPGALYGIDGQAACVASNGTPLAVQVIGSELGQSFVTFDAAEAPPEVALSPDASLACR